MSVKFRVVVCAIVFLGMAWTTGRAMSAGPAQELLPEESTAKAKKLLQQVIATLGGQAYLNVRDTECEGRVAQYGLAGDVTGFSPFHDQWLLPDKNRTEYIAKGDVVFPFDVPVPIPTARGGVLITVFNGAEGWMLDKGGVTNQPEDVIKNFNEQVESGMNRMLRSRLNEPGVEVQYGGTDIVDLKEAEWIDFTDRDHRDLRLAVERTTHLPLRWVVATRDPETSERTEMATTYTQYLAVGGVRTPMSLERLRNGRKISQTFFTSCKFNSNLDPQLFTRAALEQRAPQVAKKGYKDPKSK